MVYDLLSLALKRSSLCGGLYDNVLNEGGRGEWIEEKSTESRAHNTSHATLRLLMEIHDRLPELLLLEKCFLHV